MSINTRFLQSDGTEKVYTSARQEGTSLYYTNAGDNVETQTRGAGTELLISNPDALSEVSVECQFIDNIFLKDGILMWEGASFGDTIDMEIVLPANQPMPSDDGLGNADLVDGIIQYITASETPDETWTGNYFLFPVDYVVNRFVNGLAIMGSNHHGLMLESSDTSEVPSIFMIRLTYKSPTPSVDTKLTVTIEIYREFTV